ncbi:MAG: fused MFS/spermidine synthase, partial [Dehalococcoidia bacterium]
MGRGPSTSGAHGESRILFLLFFGSGASGLIYQIVWTRMLTLVFGNTVFAVTTVLTAVMAGLALGSFWAGRAVDRRGHFVRLYARLELGIALTALLLPTLFDQLFPLHRWAYHEFGASPYVLGLMRFIATFSLLLIPTTLMGATLPVLSRHCMVLSRQFGRQVGLLYGLNTLGAALGCFLAGFVLIGTIGVLETTYTAVAVNLLIAGIAFHVARRQGDPPSPPRTPEGRPTSGRSGTGRSLPSPVGGWVLLVVFGLSGFASLAYEVLWTRALVFFIDVDIYAFTALLTTFLAGIGLGSVLVSGIVDRRRDLVAIFALLEVGIGVFALLSIPILANLSVLGISQVSAWWMLPGVKMLDAFLVMGIPTMLMGATFPVVSRVYTTNLAHGGRSIGTLYAVNTVGAIIGAFAGGFVLLPLLGIQRSLVLV